MELLEATQSLAALAQETRLQIFRLLVEAGTRGLAAGEIRDALDVPAATLSFHLKDLAAANLITGRRDGRSINYAVNAEGMSALMDFLTRDCCDGRPELCGASAPRKRVSM